MNISQLFQDLADEPSNRPLFDFSQVKPPIAGRAGPFEVVTSRFIPEQIERIIRIRVPRRGLVRKIKTGEMEIPIYFAGQKAFMHPITAQKIILAVQTEQIDTEELKAAQQRILQAFNHEIEKQIAHLFKDPTP